METHEARLRLSTEDFGGVPLARLLGQPLDVGRFLALASQLAGALADVHAQGIVHKDLKPSNILIHPHTGAVKLIDFGIAAQLPHGPTTAMSPGVIEGSLAYISPEQTHRP
jgi:serine/threonine protein kinase